jgi:hypothetical protein
MVENGPHQIQFVRIVLQWRIRECCWPLAGYLSRKREDVSELGGFMVTWHQHNVFAANSQVIGLTVAQPERQLGCPMRSPGKGRAGKGRRTDVGRWLDV